MEAQRGEKLRWQRPPSHKLPRPVCPFQEKINRRTDRQAVGHTDERTDRQSDIRMKNLLKGGQ
jgi:hypothetical protein